MKKRLAWLPAAFFSGALIVAGCEDTRTTDIPAPEERTAAAKVADIDLEMAIRAKLESDQDLKQHPLSVQADADEKKVTISGTVPSEDIREKAIELAKAAQPGLTVTNEIEVKPAG
jgi:osmotically-inducible protein OsmY